MCVNDITLSALVEAMRQVFTPSLTVTAGETSLTNSSDHLQTDGENATFGEDCVQVVFSEMEYLPWDNSDNIVSREVERIAFRVLYNTLALLFLIGGPANVINMAVFYKQGLKDRVNLCLFCLSLSDLLFMVYLMFALGERLHMQFTTQEEYGPMTIFVFNKNLNGFTGFGFVSGIISAIIATERCVCVFHPLKFRDMLRTRTMAVIIVVVFVVVPGLFFFVNSRYRIDCIYDPVTRKTVTTIVEGKFYKAHKKFINYLDSIVYGGGLPGVVLTLVTTTTVMTIVKLRQIVMWRSQTSSSLSSRELALTKMLVANSILFIVCFSPDALNHLIRNFIPEMRTGGRYQNFFVTLLYIGDTFALFNATLNIFVYYAMGSLYRKTFWSLTGRTFGIRKSDRDVPGPQLKKK